MEVFSLEEDDCSQLFITQVPKENKEIIENDGDNDEFLGCEGE